MACVAGSVSSRPNDAAVTALLVAADLRELKELRVLLQKSQTAANNALRRCDQLERERLSAQDEGKTLRSESAVLRKSLGVANQVSTEEARKLQLVTRDRNRNGEKVAQEAQRAAAAESRVTELEKERADAIEQKRNDDDALNAMRLSAKGFQQEVFALKAHAVDTATLKRDVIGLEADLAQERGKAQAFAEEVERPMNVHRWRHLEGSDPAAHEMVLQVQSLQKRLIAVTEAGVEKGMKLQESAAELASVREQLAARPGNDTWQKLSKAQADAASKSKQIKALKAELRMLGGCSPELGRSHALEQPYPPSSH